MYVNDDTSTLGLSQSLEGGGNTQGHLIHWHWHMQNISSETSLTVVGDFVHGIICGLKLSLERASCEGALV